MAAYRGQGQAGPASQSFFVEPSYPLGSESSRGGVGGAPSRRGPPEYEGYREEHDYGVGHHRHREAPLSRNPRHADGYDDHGDVNAWRQSHLPRSHPPPSGPPDNHGHYPPRAYHASDTRYEHERDGYEAYDGPRQDYGYDRPPPYDYDRPPYDDPRYAPPPNYNRRPPYDYDRAPPPARQYDREYNRPREEYDYPPFDRAPPPQTDYDRVDGRRPPPAYGYDRPRPDRPLQQDRSGYDEPYYVDDSANGPPLHRGGYGRSARDDRAPPSYPPQQRRGPPRYGSEDIGQMQKPPQPRVDPYIDRASGRSFYPPQHGNQPPTQPLQPMQPQHPHNFGGSQKPLKQSSTSSNSNVPSNLAKELPYSAHIPDYLNPDPPASSASPPLPPSSSTASSSSSSFPAPAVALPHPVAQPPPPNLANIPAHLLPKASHGTQKTTIVPPNPTKPAPQMLNVSLKSSRTPSPIADKQQMVFHIYSFVEVLID